MKTVSTEILIVGGGPGGIFTSKALLGNGISDIKVVCDEPEVVCRCNLPYGIGRRFLNDIGDAVKSHHDFLPNFDDVGIVGKMSRIEHEERMAHGTLLESGEEFAVHYGKLILAMGGQASIPPIAGVLDPAWSGPDLTGEVVYYKGETYDKGALRRNVVVVRSVADARRIDEICATERTVAVVGSGLVGLEIVDNLLIRGNRVIVVEILPHLVSTLDPDIASLLEERLTEEGAEIRLGSPCTEVGDDYIRVGGEKIAVDLVVIGAGVSPDTELAKEVGCAIGVSGGVRVDEHWMTSVEDVYAIGDLIEIDDAVFGSPILLQLLPNVMMQGALIAEGLRGVHLRSPLAVGSGISHTCDLFWGSAGYSAEMAAARGIETFAETLELSTAERASSFARKAWYRMVVSARDEGEIRRGQILGFQAVTEGKHLGDLMARWADIIGERETVHDLTKHNWIHQPMVGDPGSNAYILTFFNLFSRRLRG